MGEGCSKGGVRGAKGVESILNKVFNKTGIVTLILVIRMHVYETKSAEISGNSRFWESPL